MMTCGSARYDTDRFGIFFRASPRQSDCMIVAGTINLKMAPRVKLLHEQMASPKYVIAMGSCAVSGGPFADGYNVVNGVDQIIPVDIYLPGCPPRPEALFDALLKLMELNKDGVPSAAERFAAARARGAGASRRPWRRARDRAGRRRTRRHGLRRPRGRRRRRPAGARRAAVRRTQRRRRSSTCSPPCATSAATRTSRCSPPSTARGRGRRRRDWSTAVARREDHTTVIVTVPLRRGLPVGADARRALVRRGAARARGLRPVRRGLRRATRTSSGSCFATTSSAIRCASRSRWTRRASRASAWTKPSQSHGDVMPELRARRRRRR